MAYFLVVIKTNISYSMPVYTDIFDPGQNTIANKQEIRLDYRVKI